MSRHLDLLRKLISAEDGHVRSAEAKRDLYSDGSSRFTDHAKALENSIANLAETMELLRWPLVELDYKKGDLSSRDPSRRFLRDLYSDPRFPHKQKIAKGLLALEESGSPVLPKAGSLFMGFGKNVFLLAWELLKHRRTYEISTPNMEIACLVYLWPSQKRRLLVGESEVDHDTGGLRAVEGELRCGTAVVSVDSFWRDGTMYSASENDTRHTNKAISQAANRVIFLIDHGKFDKNIQMVDKPIQLPAPDERKQVFLVTDEELPSGWVVPEGVKHLVVSK